MSGNFDDNEFENIENEPENIDDLYEKIDLDSIEAEIEAISQDQKSAYFFGSVDQSKFYKYLEEHNDLYTIESKFHQSGLGGFLPLSDPGVCRYMCEDFSQALIEGRYTTWKNKLEKFDKEFIEKLRAGQYDNDITLNLGTERPFGPSVERKIKIEPIADESPAAVHPEKPIAAEPPSAEELAVESEEEADQSGFQLIQEDEVSLEEAKKFDRQSFNARLIAEEIFKELNKCKDFDSCLDASCVLLNVGLTRTGKTVKLFRKDEFGHALAFTMAVDDKGRLDNKYILFMDANCGIIKIKNDKQVIKDFLDAINQKLFHTMKVRDAKTFKINHTALPKKETEKKEWDELDSLIKNQKIPEKEEDYALCKLCRLDNFLQGQIARLEIKGILEKLISPDPIRVKKLEFFQGIRKELHDCFKIFDKTISEKGFSSVEKDFKSQKESKFEEIIQKIETNLALLNKQRGFFKTETSTTVKEFEEFKKKYSADTQEPSPEPNPSKPHSKKP